MPCAREGCSREATVRGYCHSHYNVERRRGVLSTRAKAERVPLHIAFFAFVEGVHERGPQFRDFQSALGLSSTSVAATAYKNLVNAGLIEHVERGTYGYYRLTALGRSLAAEATPEYALPESGGGW